MRIFLALTLAACASCAIPTLDATARYVSFEPEGDLQITNGPASGGNSMEDLGLMDAEGTVGAMVDFKWGVPHLSISTQGSEWEGEGILEAEFSSGGITIGANTAVTSELNLDLHSALLTFDFVPGSTEVGLGFGVAGIDLSGSFEGNVPPIGVQRVEFDETVPVPMLAGRVAVDLGFVELGGYLAGLSAKVDGDEATIFDLDISGKFHLVGMDQRGGAYITVGWRQLQVDVMVDTDDEDIDAELTFSGPYAGLQLRF